MKKNKYNNQVKIKKISIISFLIILIYFLILFYVDFSNLTSGFSIRDLILLLLVSIGAFVMTIIINYILNRKYKNNFNSGDAQWN